MFKIPPAFHLRRMAKANTLEEKTKEWWYFVDQMCRENIYINKLFMDQVSKSFSTLADLYKVK